MTSDAGPVEVYVARDVLNARVMLQLLETEGIAGRIVGENLESAAGELGMSFNALPRIWVPAQDAERARALLDRADQEQGSEPSEPGLPWKCAACGAQMEGGFDLCWKCEGPRGATEETP